MGVSHAVVGVALYVFLYAANYVSETILLEAERRDMKAPGAARSRTPSLAEPLERRGEHARRRDQGGLLPRRRSTTSRAGAWAGAYTGTDRGA